MATVARINTFADQGAGRADQWMADAGLLRDFIVANVQDVDGSAQFTAAPVLSGGDPGTDVQAVRKAYMDTKLKLEDIQTDDQSWVQPDVAGSYPWFFQGGVTSVTTVVFPQEVFYITYPIPYAGGGATMAWFCLAESGSAELADNYVTQRGPTGFAGVIATTTARTVNISWLAFGPGLVAWDDISI